MDKRSILRLLGISVVGIMPPLAAEASTPDWKAEADEAASLWRIHENSIAYANTGVSRHNAITIQKGLEQEKKYNVHHTAVTWYPANVNDQFSNSETHIHEVDNFATLEEATKYALNLRKKHYGY